MGEKGLASAVTDAAGSPSTSVVASTTETVVGAVGGAAESLKDKIVDKGIDHVIEEGRERLRGHDEPGSESH